MAITSKQPPRRVEGQKESPSTWKPRGSGSDTTPIPGGPTTEERRVLEDQRQAGIQNPTVPKTPIDTSQPSSQQARAQTGTGLPGAPTVPYEQAAAQVGTMDFTPEQRTQANSTLAEIYQRGFDQTMASGVSAPGSAGQAGAQIQATTPTPEIPPSPIAGIMETDTNFDSILTEMDKWFSPPQQKQSLLQEYQSMSKALGIEDINEELIDAKRIIEGTEDDIRSEVTAAGGFATDSQVLAMANARNKSLVKNYNYLLESRDNAMQQLDTMMDLSIQDRQMAVDEFDRKLGFAFKVAEFQERATTNARNQFKYLIDSGFGSALLQSPYETQLAEKTLGLPSGGLSNIVSQQQEATGIEMDIKRQQLYNAQLTGRKLQQDITGTQPTAPLQQLASAEGNITMINDLTKSKAIDSVVGPSGLSRAPSGFFGRIGTFLKGAFAGGAVGAAAGAPFAGIGAIPGAIGGAAIGGTAASLQGAKDTMTGERQNLIAGVEQLRSQLDLDTLVAAKARGATFGALSDNELRVLSSAATKLGTWAIKDKQGNVLGYNTTESNFRKELDKINNFAKLDYILKGGMPENVGAQVIGGKIYVQNSDGTITQIP